MPLIMRRRDANAKQLNVHIPPDELRQAIDRLLGDAGSLAVDERDRRKRRLTKGSSEFREIRGDLPKPKG
jgi:hypothetical protein